MHRVTQLFLGSIILVCGVSMAPYSLAEHHEKAEKGEEKSWSMAYLEHHEIDPDLEAQFLEAWKIIQETATKEGYAFPTYVSQFRNQYYWFTPMNKYGDLDKMVAERDRVYAAGGDVFSEAVAKLNAAVHVRQTWVSAVSKDLSYKPEYDAEAEDSQKMEWHYTDINSFKVKPGHSTAMAEVLKDMKALHSELGIKRSYSIYEDKIGAEAGTFVMLSPAKDKVDAAQKMKDAEDMLKSSEKWADIYARFKSHVRTTSHFYVWPRPDLAIHAVHKDVEKMEKKE